MIRITEQLTPKRQITLLIPEGVGLDIYRSGDTFEFRKTEPAADWVAVEAEVLTEIQQKLLEIAQGAASVAGGWSISDCYGWLAGKVTRIMRKRWGGK